MAKNFLCAVFALVVSSIALAGPTHIGLVTDIGGIDDKSFNQGTWEGIKRYGMENKLKEGKDVKYLQSSAEADYVPNLTTFADEKLDLIVAPGFLFNNAMAEVATQAEVPHHRLGGEGQGREVGCQRRQCRIRRT